jgi:flagellar secretion chaperone FliS
MHSPQNQANAYLTNKVLSASPAELRLMLLDGAVKFCSQGREAIIQRNYEKMFNGFARTRAILIELMTTMKPDPNDPSLVERLRALYGYMISRLISAGHSKDLTAADEVLKLLSYERETWLMLMESLGQLKAVPQISAVPSTETKADVIGQIKPAAESPAYRSIALHG